jgi:hypothetical protein
MEAVFSSLLKPVDLDLGLKEHALVTVHLMVNIFSRQRLEFVLALIERNVVLGECTVEAAERFIRGYPRAMRVTALPTSGLLRRSLST